MSVAADWYKFALIIDGVEQRLIRDFNLYQTGNTVYVAMRNPVNAVGRFRKVRIEFEDTDLTLIDKITVVAKEGEAFGFIKEVVFRQGILPLIPDGILPDEWRVTATQSYAWGQVVAMGAAGNAESYRLSGWSGDEQGYTWTEGHRAVLGFQTSTVERSLRLSLDAVGFDSPLPQIARIFVNGRPLGILTFEGTRRMYEVTIPANYQRKDGKLAIAFDLPNAVSPLKLGRSRDSRVLGFAVWNFQLNHG
jgi:hypothetical protein